MRAREHLPGLPAACLIAGLLLPAVPVLAQVPAAAPRPSGVPAAIGNRANGLDYQPTEGDVISKEQQAGVAPSSRQQHSTTSQVETLNRQLQNAENNDPQVHPRGQGKVNPNR